MKNNEIKEEKKGFTFVFGKSNYILLVVGIVILFVGYVMLAGGGSSDPNTFNNEMFDTRRMFVAPIMIALGLIIEVLAIMLKPFKKNQPKDEE